MTNLNNLQHKGTLKKETKKGLDPETASAEQIQKAILAIIGYNRFVFSKSELTESTLPIFKVSSDTVSNTVSIKLPNTTESYSKEFFDGFSAILKRQKVSFETPKSDDHLEIKAPRATLVAALNETAEELNREHEKAGRSNDTSLIDKLTKIQQAGAKIGG